MKIGVCADLHIGNHRVMGGPFERRMNVRCRQALRVLKEAVRAAASKNVDHFVVCGDVFDTCDPFPQMIDATLQVLREHQTSKMHIWLLAGNHDQWTDAPGDNALRPLSRGATTGKASINVVDTERTQTDLNYSSTRLVFVPFRPNEPAERTIQNWVEAQKFADGSHLLFAHAGVKDAQTPPWLASASDAVDAVWLLDLMNKNHLGAAYVGNWHDQNEWHDVVGITQCGALCPTGFDNASPHDVAQDTYGRVWFDGTGPHDGTRRVTIPGPRFLNCHFRNDKWREICESYTSAGHTPYLRLVADPADVALAAAEVQRAKMMDILYEGEVVPVKSDARTAQTIAHMTHRQGRPIDESVAKFVEDFDVGENDRDRVRQRVLHYVTEAQRRGR